MKRTVGAAKKNVLLGKGEAACGGCEAVATGACGRGLGAEVSRREFLGGAACVVAGALALAGCGSASGNGSDSGSGSSSSGSPSDASGSAASGSSTSGVIDSVAEGDAYGTGTHHISIEVEGQGTIECALNANVAPITVSNFCRLAGEGFYDGLTFHRVIDGFMIQGGDPKGDGTGGSDQCIKGEFSANGVSNPISHVRGTISMARSSSYDSASSQFFIMQKTTTSLDGQYAAFGTVTSGIEVVDAIAQNTPVQDSNGTVAAADQPRIAKVTVVD